MLNKKDIIEKYTTNCIKDRPYMYIARACDQILKNVQVVLLEITEEDEKTLDDEEIVYIEKAGKDFTIYPNLCIAYGEIDLSPNSKDLAKLCELHPFGNLELTHYMLSEYDYETHTVTSDIKGGRWYDTTDPKTFLPYLYACINKPKRVAIFKEYINVTNKQQKQKAKSLSNKDATEQRKEQSKLKSDARRKDRISKLTFNVKTNG